MIPVASWRRCNCTKGATRSFLPYETTPMPSSRVFTTTKYAQDQLYTLLHPRRANQSRTFEIPTAPRIRRAGSTGSRKRSCLFGTRLVATRNARVGTPRSGNIRPPRIAAARKRNEQGFVKSLGRAPHGHSGERQDEREGGESQHQCGHDRRARQERPDLRAAVRVVRLEQPPAPREQWNLAHRLFELMHRSDGQRK